MAMDGRMHFAVRSLPSPSGLDGAFRIHLAPEHLDQVGLKVGDICEISGGEDGTALVGHGIAWRAADKMGANPKQKPVKMTETLRLAFNIKEGSHVNLRATHASIARADKVVLTDITPVEFISRNAAEMDDDKWWWRCGYSLVNCEAFATGVTFELAAKKGVRKRYFIESVEAEGAPQAGPRLYYCNDRTQVVINDAATSPDPTMVEEDLGNVLADAITRIGGLEEQLNILSNRMIDVINTSRANRDPSINAGILIHGYEGTGKSFLLKQMELVGFHKVVHLQKSDLAATAMTNRTIIRSKFEDVLKCQPSLVLIDDLDQIAPSSGELYGDTLADCLDQLAGTRVLVVAACRNPIDVCQRLLEPDRLLQLIELPIPDMHARYKILQLMLPDDDFLPQSLSLRTHGFTGRDLLRVVQLAKLNARHRSKEQLEAWAERVAEKPSGNRLLDGAVHSLATSQVEHEQKGFEVNDDPPQIALTDFEVALTQMRPTALREIFFEKPQVQWSDIGGSHAVKARFDRILGWPLQHAQDMDLLSLKGRKGVLLYGPPGCSKTLTAQAVATTYELNFIAVQGAELISMYVGESERAVREIFRKARAAAPCVIFFDEIDSIASAREGSGTKGLNVLTTLLNEMDGFQSLKGVLVLAATNRPEILDPAIMRPGRFDAHIYLGPPGHEARREILEIQMRGIPTEGVDLDFFAEATEGYTGAEMVEICQAAKEAALERKIHGGDHPWPVVRNEDLEKALKETTKAVSAEMIQAYQDFAER